MDFRSLGFPPKEFQRANQPIENVVNDDVGID